MKAEVQKEEVKVEEKQDINEDPNKDKFGESTDFKGLQSQVILGRIYYKFIFLLNSIMIHS